MINRDALCLASLALSLLGSVNQVHGAQATPGATTTSGLSMKSLLVDVEIVDGVATTLLRQTLHNSSPREGQADWLLPLPQGAVADGFEMKVGGVALAGDVLDARGARRVYEEIVRQRRDPGLLEYVGGGCLRARVFPIPPQGDVEVEVRFRQVLPELSGLWRWSLPLETVGLLGRAPVSVVLDLSVQSTGSLRNVFSPTGGVHVLCEGDHRARASFEGGSGLEWPRSLELFYGLSEAEFGLNLFSHKPADESAGSFLMMISPKQNWADGEIVAKDIRFVLDTSGSMTGAKIAQAQEAARFFLRSLKPDDHFNVIPFSTGTDPFFPSAVPASEQNIETALSRVDRIEASGGTNLDEALRRGLSFPAEAGGRLPLLVFLTDGLPTVGENDVRTILRNALKASAVRARVFVFGVGNDVNTFLLDQLAEQSGGARHYVAEREPIEEKTGALFTKLSSPVLTDLEIAVEGIELSRTVPSRLPDLFRSSRVLLHGRYRGGGRKTVTLRGRVGDVRVEYAYEADFASAPRPDHEFVTSLWAERRVAVLLDAVRLNGPAEELLAEISDLGIEHNIVTPYTSHLILEDGLDLSQGDLLGGRRRSVIWHANRTPHPIPVSGGARGGGGGGPSSPGPAGPSAPGPRGPMTAGSSGTATTPKRVELDRDRVIERLLEAGVLPKSADRAELAKLADTIARELQNSTASLDGLGQNQSGERAVADSAYLARLINSGGSDDFFIGHGQRSASEHLLSLFVRKIGERVFRLREGVWIDRAYVEKTMSESRRRVQAYTTEYFELLREHPELSRCLALSDRMILVLDGQAIEISPDAWVAPVVETPVSTDRAGD